MGQESLYMFHVKHVACSFPISLHCQTKKKNTCHCRCNYDQEWAGAKPKRLQLRAQLPHRGYISVIPYQKRSLHLELSQQP
jgi:hypothetical protein